MERCKMALIQMNSVFGDVDKNLASAEAKIRQAHENGAQFVCLPEAFHTGYYCNKIKEMAELAEPLDGKTIRLMRRLASELKLYIMAPIIREVDGAAENTAVLICDEGEIVGMHSKTHPVGDEAVYFRRGTTYEVFPTKYGKVGLLVCYDVSFPETARILALKGAEIILVPVACRDLSFYRGWLYNNFAARGVDNVVYLAAACMVGRGLPESPFTGCSQFISPRGEIMAVAGDTEEEILYQELDLSNLEKERMENTVLKDRHPEDYKILSELR